jgi:hypothetical protein
LARFVSTTLMTFAVVPSIQATPFSSIRMSDVDAVAIVIPQLTPLT